MGMVQNQEHNQRLVTNVMEQGTINVERQTPLGRVMSRQTCDVCHGTWERNQRSLSNFVMVLVMKKLIQ